jgi:hypothetical protein
VDAMTPPGRHHHGQSVAAMVEVAWMTGCLRTRFL